MIKQWIGEAFLRVAGWKTEGDRPPRDRYVIIAAPHTSNWDLPFMLAMAFVYDIPVRWMGKHTLFKAPYGTFFKWLGGMPIIRHRPGGVVGQMIEAFDEVMNDAQAVEDCKVWMLKQKQTQDWKTTKATADAVYALLLRGTNLLASDELVQIALGGEVIEPDFFASQRVRLVQKPFKPDEIVLALRKAEPSGAVFTFTMPVF